MVLVTCMYSCCSASFTLVPFFFVYDDPTQTPFQIGYLDPAELVRPSDEDLEMYLAEAGLVNIDVQDVPSFKNVQNSFGLFIDGTVYEEDIDGLLEVLTAHWQQSNDGEYATATCVNGFIEKYFTSIDA